MHFLQSENSSRTCTAALDTGGKQKHQRKKNTLGLVSLLALFTFADLSQTPGFKQSGGQEEGGFLHMNIIKWNTSVVTKPDKVSEEF